MENEWSIKKYEQYGNWLWIHHWCGQLGGDTLHTKIWPQEKCFGCNKEIPKEIQFQIRLFNY